MSIQMIRLFLYLPDQSGSGRVASAARAPKNQLDASHIAFGSRVLGPPPLTGRKNSGLSEGQGQDGRTQDGRTHRIMNMVILP